MTTVREEKPGDIPGVRQVNTLAFDRPMEADLALELRAGALANVHATLCYQPEFDNV